MKENCKDNIKSIRKLYSDYNEILPTIDYTYNYILLDISSKQKVDYINYCNRLLSQNKFKSLIDISAKNTITPSIHHIFLNYIFIGNMIKKEITYLTTKLYEYIEKIDIYCHDLDDILHTIDIIDEDQQTLY